MFAGREGVPGCRSVPRRPEYTSGDMSEPPSRLPVVLFGLLLALCLTLALAVVVEPEGSAGGPGSLAGPVSASGAAHPRFPSMDHGGSGPGRHGPVLWLAWAFGILQLALVVGCLALGAPRARVRARLVAGGLVLAAIVTMMVVSYSDYLADPGAAFLDLPVPTAWFLYGFWPAQFLVVGLYVLLFDREIVTGRDLEQFRAIVARRSSPDGAARRPVDPPGVGVAPRRRLPARWSSPLGFAAGPIDPGRGSEPPPAV